MPKIKIVTDSTADLGPELTKRYGVEVVPLIVTFDEETYTDGVDIDTQRLFQLVKEKGKLPKTSSPSPETFRSVFEKAIADGSQVIYIGISSQFSASVQSARLVANTFPEGQVHVFDSANLSTGIAQLVLYAHDLAARIFIAKVRSHELRRLTKQIARCKQRIPCALIASVCIRKQQSLPLFLR
jgi:DegV family protein with EDD domain